MARNSLAGLLRYAITVPILLATVPFILHKLGPEVYGVWALFGVVTGFADLSDLGIAAGLVRFIARYWAEKDTQSINRAISTVLAVYIVFGGLIVVFLALSGRFVTEKVFNLPGSFVEEAVFVITGAAIAFYISLLGGTFGSLMQGVQRMDAWNLVLVFYTVVDSASAVSALAIGYGLYGLVVSRIMVTLSMSLLAFWLAHRIFPALSCRPSYFDRSSGCEIILYSLNIWVTKMSGIARDPLNKTILLWVASLSGVGFFDLGARIANQARGLFSAMLIPVVAAAAGVQAIGGKEATRHLFYRSTRYVALLVLPVFGGLIVFAKHIVTLWIGADYGLVALTLQVLLLAFFLTLLSTPAYSILEGTGLARVNAVTSLASALLGVGLSIGLGQAFGYVGVVMGYCLSGAVGSIATLVAFNLKLKVPFGEFMKAIPMRVVLVYCFAILMSGIMLRYTDPGSTLIWGAIGIGYFATCTVGVLFPGNLAMEELRAVKRILVLSPKLT